MTDNFSIITTLLCGDKYQWFYKNLITRQDILRFIIHLRINEWRYDPSCSYHENPLFLLEDVMAIMRIEINPIGIVRSPYATMADAPHQGRFSDQESEIIIDEAYSIGLTDIEHHPHLIVLSWLDRAERNTLTAIPPHDLHHREHGVFATRSPHRPNPIGLCVVDLIKRNGRTLRVRGLDVIDGTPVLDIKPFSRGIDCVPDKQRKPITKNER